MPSDLLKAHQRLDALVERAYGRKFANDAGIHRPLGRSRSEALCVVRVAHLFDLYAAKVKEIRGHES